MTLLTTVSAALDTVHDGPTAHASVGRPRILCLSGLFSTDRILFYSSLAETIERHADLSVWSYGPRDAQFPHDHPVGRRFELLPERCTFRFRTTLARHFDNYLWDHLTTSRGSFWDLRKKQSVPPHERWLRSAARVARSLGLQAPIERRIERSLIRRPVAPEIRARLEALRPSAILVMNPWMDVQQEIGAAARALSIPMAAFVTSWDNPTTKGRLILRYDAYIAWSRSMKDELCRLYPAIREEQVEVTGAPQYDAFFRSEFQQTRTAWCGRLGLDAARPVVVYSLGSPNLIREDYGVAPFLEALARRRDLEGVQVVVRLHPGFHERGYAAIPDVRARFPEVRIQGSLRDDQPVAFQQTHQIVEWVNTVRHADVVVNLASTMTVDAAVCDRPVVNLDFDPEPGGPNQRLVRAANHEWDHFSPLTRTGGFWLARTTSDAVDGVAAYLRTPGLHREGRVRIAQMVAGEADGRAGARMARVVDRVLAGAGAAGEAARTAVRA